jgi:cation:H+ antiporter
MLIDVGLLVLGGVLLYFGAEWLVGGASGTARRLGVRPLVVGLTVVAWGTSAPELVVSVAAALKGSSAIAIGNVVGSNIANLGLILGLTALIAPPQVDKGLIRREVPVLIFVTAAIPLVLINDYISRVEGLVLGAGAVLFSLWLVKTGRQEPDVDVDALNPADTPKSPAKLALLIVVGGVGLVAGGRAFVEGATGIAQLLGMSGRVVGLTVVAVGTSLPEMATSIVAAFRKHSDLAVGNVVGSNIFNVLLVLGPAAAIQPMQAELAVMHLDMGVMLGMTLVAALMMRTGRIINRVEGILLATGYFGFLAAVIIAR